ncbi:MAG: SPFH domain-containing protein [Kiritimatiellae bacterium]|nr:SPFH domain-containing protein [Kiritimatiellia bacterium]
MKAMMKALAGLVAMVAALAGAYLWFFCRFYVGPDQMAVITAKTGAPLPPGQILAKKGQRGIREDVLGEGRYFYDPFLYERKIMPVIFIPPGKVGVVTAKVGENLPQGEFLAEPGQKGVWKRVLGPGKYRLNPYGYTIEVVDAVSIPIGYVGVITSLSGTPAPAGEFAGAGQKGIRRDVLQPGLYYVNPKQYKVDVLEIGVNQVSLLGRQGGEVLTKRVAMDEKPAAAAQLAQNLLAEQQEKRRNYLAESSLLGLRSRAAPRADRQAAGPPSAAAARAVPAAEDAVFVLNQFVSFPSRDGFEISLDMTVEFELLPDRIAGIFRTYGDLPAVVEKAIMPQILSVSRLKGSAYKVTDFIAGDGREKFQIDLTEALSKVLGERDIVVHNALIRHVNVPENILTPIREASIAKEQDETNKEKQNTARKQAQLNTETAMIAQKGEQVRQETQKLVAEIRAAQELEVGRIAAETQRTVAEIESRTAELTARRQVTLGEAAAESVRKVEGERARGQQLRVAAFRDPTALSLWTFATQLSTNLRVHVIHAGEGTLWTDLRGATLGDLGGARVLSTPSGAAPPASAAPAAR